MRSLCERRRQHPLVANAHSRVARAAGASSAWLAGWAGGSIAPIAVVRRDLPAAKVPLFFFESHIFDAPGEHSLSLFAALGVASSASLAAPAYQH